MNTVLNIVKWLSSKYKMKGNETVVVEILYHYFSDKDYSRIDTTLNISEIVSYFDTISLEYDCLLLGNVYQSLLDASHRHSNGVHYTQKEDIHRIIDYLFYNDLLVRVKESDSRVYSDINSLVFFDPACGCGNILVYIYHLLLSIQKDGGYTDYIKASNFYGIELDSGSAYIASLSLSLEYYRFSGEIVSYDTITCGDSLKIDWGSVVPKDNLSYIVANPPFLGSSNMKKALKRTIEDNFYNFEGRDGLDLCCFWYIKSAEFIQGSDIRVSILSSDCVNHGTILYNTFNYIKSRCHIYYDFMYDTFEFKSLETYCCVLGFSSKKRIGDKYYIDRYGKTHVYNNLNIYGLDTDVDILVRPKNYISLNPVSVSGSSDIYDTTHIFSSEERNNILKDNSWLERYFILSIRQDFMCSNCSDYYVFDINSFLVTNSVDSISHIGSIYKIIREHIDSGCNKIYKARSFKESCFCIPRFIRDGDSFLSFRLYEGDSEFLGSHMNFILDCDYSYLAILISDVYLTYMRKFCSTSFGNINYNKDFHSGFYIPRLDDVDRELLRDSFIKISNLIETCVKNGITVNSLQNDTPDNLKALIKDNNDIVKSVYGFSSDSDLGLAVYKMHIRWVMG
nr:MAG TPA: MmeI/DNA Complex-protein complex, Restriction-Modification enzyme, Hydrolase-DNA [Bacteriophage sp.]